MEKEKQGGNQQTKDTTIEAAILIIVTVIEAILTTQLIWISGN